MIYEELHERYGALTAERVRQALTLAEMRELEIEELGSYFEHRAEKIYREYRARLESPLRGNIASIKPKTIGSVPCAAAGGKRVKAGIPRAGGTCWRAATKAALRT